MSDSARPGEPELSRFEDPSFHQRYAVRAHLGAGTSGDVALCLDRHIGREVAVKLLRADVDARSSERARFLREARLQGRLEHPGVAAVHDLGAAPAGRPWFTMKLVRGETLAESLERTAADPEQLRRARPRLLAAFARVCRTIDFAHAQGVVHRDLSPRNVMLGEYGEVLVLDWGLAKRVRETEGATAAEPSDDDSVDEPSLTLPGTALGTPGYLAPEQALGEVDIGPEADVFALGAILYEVLAGRPLHGGESSRERLANVIRGVDVELEARRAGVDVPPELAPILARATRGDAARRLRSAGELAAAVESFLDGDRDLAERRRLAMELVAAARARRDAGQSEPHRAEVTRLLGRALALDPSNAEAGALLSRILLEPSEEPGPEVRERLSRWADDIWQRAARSTVLRYTLWALFIPVWFLMGIRDWPAAILAIALLLGMNLTMGLIATRTLRGFGGAAIAFAVSTAGIAVFTQVLSPVLVAPTLMATNLIVYAAHASKRARYAAIAVSVLAMAVPIALEAVGVLPRTFEVVAGDIVIHPRVVDFEPTVTWWILLAGATVSVGVPALVAGRVRDALVDAERRLVHQTWHLEQVVPRGE